MEKVPYTSSAASLPFKNKIKVAQFHHAGRRCAGLTRSIFLRASAIESLKVPESSSTAAISDSVAI